MARGLPTLNAILKVLPALSKSERRRVMEGLCHYPDSLEDLHDILLLLERKDEPSRPYDAFVAELRADGRL